MNRTATIETQEELSFETKSRLVVWAFKGHLPYGIHPDNVVDEMNESSAELIAEPVALSHAYVMEEGELRKHTLPKDDIVQGEFGGFELIQTLGRIPVGVRMNVNLVPGSSPGLYREEVVPLWSEESESLRVLDFNYRRTSGSIWKKILENSVRFRY